MSSNAHELSWREKEEKNQEYQMLLIQAIRACGQTHKKIEEDIREVLKVLA